MSTEVVQWIDADSAATTLNVRWAVSGRYMPPIAFEEDGAPGQPGGLLRAVRHDVKEFTLPLDISAVSDVALRTAMRGQVTSMNPTRGTGKVRVTAPGGDQREIECVYKSGLDMNETLGADSGPLFQVAPVTFRAHWPYWKDVSPQTIGPFSTGVTPTFYPFFPMRLTSSTIAVDTTINNDGDVDVWPQWHITGPGSSIILRNLTSDKLIQFGTTALSLGQYIDIDTMTYVKTVVRSDGTNLYPDLTATSDLWPLVPGSNAVRLEMGGVDAAASALSGSYYRQYLSP